MRRREQAGIVLAVLLAVVLPYAVHGVPTTARGVAVLLLLTTGGLALVGWRDDPRRASTACLALTFLALVVGPREWSPDSSVLVASGGFAVLALAWSGRAAVLVQVLALAYVAALVAAGATGSWVAALMFTVPAFVAGTLFRLRRETVEALARRALELEHEQQLLADLSVRQERQRIAGELHDVVGHALSVLVIQAAAGQRLVDTAPGRVDETFTVIAASARRGAADLERLSDLLGGSHAPSDLGRVHEVVAHAVRSGLDVSYRVDADSGVVPDAVAHLVHRVVQEGLTNALRHAPGAPIRIRVAAPGPGGSLVVTVENDRATQVGTLRGTGSGLTGLGERVRATGGRFRAGPTASGGWLVEAGLRWAGPV